MEIKWNEVTWYSKLAAIILLLGVLPVFTFFMGMEYREVQASLFDGKQLTTDNSQSKTNN